MSGITTFGNLYSLIRTHPLSGKESVWFLRHLLKRVSRRLLVIWDGSPIHRGQEVKNYLADGGGKLIHIERLPPYAPDRNPDEGVWDLLKYVEMRNLCCADLRELYVELRLAARRLRSKPHLIRSCFGGAGLEI